MCYRAIAVTDPVPRFVFVLSASVFVCYRKSVRFPTDVLVLLRKEGKVSFNISFIRFNIQKDQSIKNLRCTDDLISKHT